MALPEMQFETALVLLRHKPITSRDRFLSLACKTYKYQHKTKYKLEQKTHEAVV